MSEREVRELYEDGLAFHRELVDRQWQTEDSGAIDALQYSPADLFSNADRPLVVGLFGGTGVGKSSLLNRLAGADIARTGVVRPTSMEITVYLHEDVEISALPAYFPRENISDNRHRQASFERVMWVDMPDFDSDETQNRDQVKQWLPHIDLLIYVVSPERYKDQQGWQLLQQYGYRHAWLFVLNHWDRAQPVQQQDFNQLLMRAGFESPRIFRTVCSGEPHPDDEFDALSKFVTRLSERKFIALLEEHGWVNRLRALGAQLDEGVTQLQGASGGAVLHEVYREEMRKLQASAQNNLALPFKQFSQQYAEQNISPVKTVYKSLTGRSDEQAGDAVRSQVSSPLTGDVSSLWDDWSQTRLDDSMERFRQATEQHGFPAALLQPVTDRLQQSTGERIRSELQTHLNTALLNPGAAWQRMAVTVAGYLKFVLPLVVLMWIVYRALDGFIDGADDRSAYVGMDFLVNGLILGVISWLVPWLLSMLLKPSVPEAVNKALHQALTDAISESSREASREFDALAAEREQLLQRGEPLQQQIQRMCDRSAILQDADLNQLLVAGAERGN